MDPRQIPTERLETMRADVAREYKLSPYTQYAEKKAATFLNLDLSTVRRNRRAGRVPHVSTATAASASSVFSSATTSCSAPIRCFSGVLPPPLPTTTTPPRRPSLRA